MLHTAQRWALAPGELEMSQSAWRDPRAIVTRTRTRGLSAMELASLAPRPLPHAGPPVRAWTFLVLAGEARVSASWGEAIVRAGEVLVTSDARQHGTSADVDLVRIVLPCERPIAAQHVRLDRSARARVARLALCVERGDPRAERAAGAVALARVLEVLASPGIDPEEALDRARAEPTPHDRRMAALLARLSSELGAHPGIDDVARALDVPERRASELTSEYFRRYHVGFEGWRPYLSMLRAELASSALATRALRSGELARRLGFRAAPALYHALERRGLSVDSLSRARSR